MSNKQSQDQRIIADKMVNIYSQLGIFKGQEIERIYTLLLFVLQKNGLGDC